MISTDTRSIKVRLAKSVGEVGAAQHLRYRVFYEEFKATPSDEIAAQKRDFDEFDDVADHLVVIDDSRGEGCDRIVGTYRLLRQECAERHGRFYTSDEFDISPLQRSGISLLELGRSCVLSEYRIRPVMQLLWGGIADYVREHDVGLMFGCASIHETDIAQISQSLAYLYHHHLAPGELCPRALGDRYVDMNLHPKDTINPREAFIALPPLIKGYLRLGATIGDGAVIDHVFRTTDVCIVLPTELITSRYRKHYERKSQAADGTGDNESLGANGGIRAVRDAQ
ncbi:MAG: GNAT family N-acetyltransferase [Spartobacteria bacterium]|nr:GNAT family N-acetyltransferase [Spartobacteria bacterium]